MGTTALAGVPEWWLGQQANGQWVAGLRTETMGDRVAFLFLKPDAILKNQLHDKKSRTSLLLFL